MTPEPAGIDHRNAAAVAFQIAAREQVAQVQITAAVLAQQDQPGRVPAAAMIGDQQLGADQRLDPGALRGAIELDQGEQIGVVGQRDRGHLQLGGPLHQLRDADQAVLQRVFAVQIQVDKGRVGHRLRARSLVIRTG